MTVNMVLPPYETFKDVDGDPLESGYIFIGNPGLNAEASPKTAYFDKEKTIVAAQPIRTIGGFPVYLGAPARIYVDDDYSIVVKDRRQQLVQSALTSGVGIVGPDEVSISFETLADLNAATISDEVSVVMAKGLVFILDPTGTAQTSNGGTKRWSPPLWNITPEHWGAVPDASTDSLSQIQAMLDWGATVQEATPWDPIGKTPDGTRLVYDMGQGTYAVTGQIDLNAGNAHCIIQDASIIAIGGGWSTTGSEIIWQDGSVVAPTDPDPETAISGTIYFRHVLDDFIFNCKSNATYITFESPNLNCNGKCGGIYARTRTLVRRPNIKRIGWVARTIPGGGTMEDAYNETAQGAIGIYAASGDVHVRDGWVGQFDQSDPEYYDGLQWNAIGIYAGDSDLTVIGTKFRWAWSNIVMTGTNHRFDQIHSFNGMRSYSWNERNAEDQTMLDAYFGFDTSAYNFPIRYYHAGVAVMAHRFEWDGSTWTRRNGQNWDSSFDGCYFDNCHFDLHSDGVRFNNPKLGSKPTSSLSFPGATYVDGSSVTPTGSINYWWKAWANGTANQVQRLSIHGLEPFVEGTVKQIVLFEDADETWLNRGVAFAMLNNNLMDEENGDNWEMKAPYTHLNPERGFQSATVFTFGSGGSFFRFADGTSTAVSGEITGGADFGADTDNAYVRADYLETRTLGISMTEQSVEPPSAADYTLAMSDGTASTNGFGTAGAGLYEKLSGTWNKL